MCELLCASAQVARATTRAGDIPCQVAECLDVFEPQRKWRGSYELATQPTLCPADAQHASRPPRRQEQGSRHANPVLVGHATFPAKPRDRSAVVKVDGRRPGEA